MLSGSGYESEADAPWSLAGTYDGHRYQLKIKLAPGADGIALDEDAAQRLGCWLTREAADEHRRRREDERRPDCPW